MSVGRLTIIVIHALIGWALCGATIAIGSSVTDMDTTLIIHAIAAPVIFALLTFIYFRNFSYNSPLSTALWFVGIVIAMDAGIVAPLIEKSYQMFQSLLGTWIPFALIFTSTYITGYLLRKKRVRTEN